MHETWQLHKPAVTARHGLVVSQHQQASEAGAEILAAGGSAIDAAIATSACLGVVEPWMSGLGGVLVGVYLERATGQSHAIHALARAPRALDPRDYPLTDGVDQDLFGWPAVLDGRNVHGYRAIGTPGVVAGWALLHQRFGRLPWATLLEPAIAAAKRGFSVDWFSTLKIAAAAKLLQRDPISRDLWLPDGLVPAGSWAGPPPALQNAALVVTLEQLAHAGPTDFYRGDVAMALVADLQAGGAAFTPADFADYTATLTPAAVSPYRGHHLHYAPTLNGGESVAYALTQLAQQPFPADAPRQYRRYGEALQAMWRDRFAHHGHDRLADDDGESCTTHLAVVDGDGNVVSLTQTLLSVFGSKVTLPRTGVLMNNAMMWFDPRPGRPNSLQAGATPLANMAPVILQRDDGDWIALGGSGGRRILPAVVQLASFLADQRLDVAAALQQPRLDVSGGPTMTVDARLDEAVLLALDELGRRVVAADGVYPNLFACPNLAVAHGGGGQTGVAFRQSPVAGVAAVERR